MGDADAIETSFLFSGQGRGKSSMMQILAEKRALAGVVRSLIIKLGFGFFLMSSLNIFVSMRYIDHSCRDFLRASRR